MSSIFGKQKQMLTKASLPDASGVYFFVDARKKILYIGKATSLKNRVRSYFSKETAQTRGPKIVRMLELAESIEWQSTDSVLEALLLEASLIKKHQPHYNTDEKDDKSFSLVVITKEIFPRVLLLRERDIQGKQAKALLPIKYTFGPFPQGSAVREALKIIRKIFPFRDTCTPLSGKPCFRAQLGLCPGVCRGDISPQEYASTIRHIKLFFEGKKLLVVRRLEKKMKEAAKALQFEKAHAIKKTLFALRHIHDVALLKKEPIASTQGERTFRIEAYDIAHLAGQSVVGVMAVVSGGVPQKQSYRKFKLTNERNDDGRNLEEIVTRRLKHLEWTLPQIIVADGSDLQINTIRKVLKSFQLDIPVVGVVKDAHHKPKDIAGDEALINKHKTSIELANSEAHRFAIAYHRFHRNKTFLGAKKRPKNSRELDKTLIIM
jgi:excinuclease ABC subunit C